MAYQSFPSAPGDSSSLEKLVSLRLPELQGKAFLDVGCNEGFFCGFALFAGASRVVGIDRSAPAIRQARQRFPECEFRDQSWDVLPEGPFDVILLASALHYAESQPELVQRLLGVLRPGGKLVLEIGVANGEGDWKRVVRGIDTRDFPTWKGLRQLFKGAAYRHVGPSVRQRGDPTPRHVFHVTHRRPYAFLLMGRPASGKSSICRSLFEPAGVPVVSGDLVIGRIARGVLEAPAALAEVAREDFSPLHIDRTNRAVFAAGLGPELVNVWVAETNGQDFALDSFVPEEEHALVVRELRARGYLVVTLDCERIDTPPARQDSAEAMAKEYFKSLGEREPAPPTPKPSKPTGPVTRGHVDQVSLEGDRLMIRGWAVDPSGNLPEALSVLLDENHRFVRDFEKRDRPDVKKNLGIAGSLVGFRLYIPLAELDGIPHTVDVAAGWESDGSRRTFAMSPKARTELAALRARVAGQSGA